MARRVAELLLVSGSPIAWFSALLLHSCREVADQWVGKSM